MGAQAPLLTPGTKVNSPARKAALAKGEPPTRVYVHGLSQMLK